MTSSTVRIATGLAAGGLAILDRLGAAPSPKTRDIARTAVPTSFVGRELEPGVRAGVAAEDAEAAGVRQDRHAASARQGLRREHVGQVPEQSAPVVGADLQFHLQGTARRARPRSRVARLLPPFGRETSCAANRSHGAAERAAPPHLSS